MANNEKKWNRKYADDIRDNDNIYSVIIPDNYIMTKRGIMTTKKPFDRMITVGGIACEFKYKKGGLTFNMDKWKTEQPHQLEGLCDFASSGCGIGVLMIFWKPTGKRDVKKKFLYSWECETLSGKIKFDDMRNEIELRSIMKSWRIQNEKLVRLLKSQT